MKISLLILILLNIIFANDIYEKKGEIDMHGGKKDSLSSQSFSQQIKLKSLQELSIKKPSNIEKLEVEELKDLSIKNNQKKEKRN